MRCQLSHPSLFDRPVSARMHRVKNWLKGVVRQVLRPPRPGGSAPAPGRRTIVWRMDPSAAADDRPDRDTAERFAATLPMAAEDKGWMMSSIDLMTGVEILEDEKSPTDPPADDTGPVGPRQDRS